MTVLPSETISKEGIYICQEELNIFSFVGNKQLYSSKTLLNSIILRSCLVIAHKGG